MWHHSISKWGKKTGSSEQICIFFFLKLKSKAQVAAVKKACSWKKLWQTRQLFMGTTFSKSSPSQTLVSLSRVQDVRAGYKKAKLGEGWIPSSYGAWKRLLRFTGPRRIQGISGVPRKSQLNTLLKSCAELCAITRWKNTAHWQKETLMLERLGSKQEEAEGMGVSWTIHDSTWDVFEQNYGDSEGQGSPGVLQFMECSQNIAHC